MTAIVILMEPLLPWGKSTTLRNLAVDRLAWACPEGMFMDMVGDLPKEAVVDTAKALKTGHEMCAEDFYFAED
jgi:hypothetical protein